MTSSRVIEISFRVPPFSAFVKIDERYADRAVEALNNCFFFGKQIKVQFSKQNADRDRDRDRQVFRHFLPFSSDFSKGRSFALGPIWHQYGSTRLRARLA